MPPDQHRERLEWATNQIHYCLLLSLFLGYFVHQGLFPFYFIWVGGDDFPEEINYLASVNHVK